MPLYISKLLWQNLLEISNPFFKPCVLLFFNEQLLFLVISIFYENRSMLIRISLDFSTIQTLIASSGTASLFNLRSGTRYLNFNGLSAETLDDSFTKASSAAKAVWCSINGRFCLYWKIKSHIRH